MSRKRGHDEEEELVSLPDEDDGEEEEEYVNSSSTLSSKLLRPSLIVAIGALDNCLGVRLHHRRRNRSGAQRSSTSDIH